MVKIWVTGLVVFVAGCSSAPRVTEASAAKRQVASAQDPRLVYSFISSGTVRRSRFLHCLYRGNYVPLEQFAVVLDSAGRAQRDNFDGIDGTFPCPKVVQQERGMGWNVATLSRFRQDEKWYQCEYVIRGDTYLCEVDLPTNEGGL